MRALDVMLEKGLVMHTQGCRGVIEIMLAMNHNLDLLCIFVSVDVLVIGQVKSSRVFLQPFIIVGNGFHKKAHRLGRVSGAPFLAGFFQLDARWDRFIFSHRSGPCSSLLKTGGLICSPAR